MFIVEDKNKNIIHGVVVGIVTNNKDPEDLGRIKVNFPWRGIQDESIWARIATLMAGQDRGSYFLPEIGDEVLVSFEHGDIHQPYVIGSLWNGQDKPPETNSDGKNNNRLIKSRSGHKFIFNDSEYNYQLVSFHPKNNSPFNEITITDKRKGLGYYKVFLLIDNEADGELDEILKGGIPLKEAQTHYIKIIEEGLASSKLEKTNGYILCK